MFKVNIVIIIVCRWVRRCESTQYPIGWCPTQNKRIQHTVVIVHSASISTTSLMYDHHRRLRWCSVSSQLVQIGSCPICLPIWRDLLRSMSDVCTTWLVYDLKVKWHYIYMPSEVRWIILVKNIILHTFKISNYLY